MKFAYKIPILVTVITSLLACVNTFSVIHRDSEIGLLNYMARSNDLLKQDPARSLNCFNEYLPLINEIAKNYEINLKSCLNGSEAARVSAGEVATAQLNELTNAAEVTCKLLRDCQQKDSHESALQCYIDGGSVGTHFMYVINANASRELAALREEYYLIQNEEYKCTNETKRLYEMESLAAYDNLNDCILGNSDTVTAKTTTSAKTTTAEPKPTSDQPTEPKKNLKHPNDY